MTSVLITGGLGVVGRHLVRTMRQRGYDVWLTDQFHHHDDRYIRCDIGSYRQVANLFHQRDFDLVYHLAAEFGRWNGEDYYDTLWRTNVIGTKNIIRFQEALNFRLVFASSSEVYGDWDEVMAESVMDNHEIRQLNDYALTKWVNEQQILNSAKMYNTKSVRLRLFNTYGEGEYYTPYRSVNCVFTYRALHGLPFVVYKNHYRTSSYITDTVNTIANVADNFIPGEVYNIASTEYHDIPTLSNLVLRETGRKEDLITYKEAEPYTTRNKKVDVTKAIKDLNHSPSIKLKDGVAKTVAWMIKVYGLDNISDNKSGVNEYDESIYSYAVNDRQ